MLQFIQAACNEIKEVRVVNQFAIDLPYSYDSQVVSGTVKCGTFEPVHVTKKENKVLSILEVLTVTQKPVIGLKIIISG